MWSQFGHLASSLHLQTVSHSQMVTICDFFFLVSFQLCDSSYKHGDSIIKRSGPIRWWFNFSPQLTVEISVPMVIRSQGLSVYEEASLIFIRQHIPHRFLLCIILLQLCYCPGQKHVFGCPISISPECFQTHLPPPAGAAELIACTISVVRASSKLVINSTFFPSGQPGKESNSVLKKQKTKQVSISILLPCYVSGSSDEMLSNLNWIFNSSKCTYHGAIPNKEAKIDFSKKIALGCSVEL